jgi:hypothetical protein
MKIRQIVPAAAGWRAITCIKLKAGHTFITQHIACFGLTERGEVLPCVFENGLIEPLEPEEFGDYEILEPGQDSNYEMRQRLQIACDVRIRASAVEAVA